MSYTACSSLSQANTPKRSTPTMKTYPKPVNIVKPTQRIEASPPTENSPPGEITLNLGEQFDGKSPNKKSSYNASVSKEIGSSPSRASPFSNSEDSPVFKAFISQRSVTNLEFSQFTNIKVY